VGELETRFASDLAGGAAGDRLREAYATGLFTRGVALADSGEFAEAEAAFDQCRRTLAANPPESLLEGPGPSPPSPDLMAIGARALVELGRAQRADNRLNDAARTQVDAVERLLALTAEFPEDAGLRYHLARAYGELGELVNALGGAADASRAHTEAVKLLSELVKADPEVAAYRLELARQYGAVSDLVRDAGQTDKAREYIDGAIAFLVDLCANDPGNFEFAAALSREEGRRAELLTDAGDSAAAVQLLHEAVSRAEAFASTVSPGGRRFRTFHRLLAGLFGQLGHASEAAEQKNQAIAHFAKAVEHWKLIASGGGDTDSVREGLAWSQERLKKLQP
jgi:tetratricopeptide (TPR) repeat protein